MTSHSGKPNRLLDESSPYLQQHAYNPVDWYPWGEEAIARARDLDRPIFLSIGYSACHWCHVMEHESFENDDIARLMNETCVCIKVDREERPDIDQIYMNAVTLLTGHGGWPMSVFLTPDLKPFFGGTYWPPQPRMNMPGFSTILQRVHQAWIGKRDRLAMQADELTNAIVKVSGVQTEATILDESLLSEAESALQRSADRKHGGFGGAPKFPHPMNLRVLLRQWKRSGNVESYNVVTETLDKMAGGGIYDHLGGGFARYSTDARWLAPHFEKMLYDNALLVCVYIEGYRASGKEDYSRVVRETLDYVLREMTQPEGGFYSTQDADSEGEEGRFFVWNRAEIDELLGDDSPAFCHCFDVTTHGNWEGKTILNRPQSLQTCAEQLDTTPDALMTLLDRCRIVLFDARAKRIAPGRDDKVLASWNGLMIAAMAMAGRVLDEPRYVTSAEQAAGFVLTHMRENDGRLLHSFKDGEARFNAYLDDYTCMIDGLVELFQSTGEPRWLTSGIELAGRLSEQFEDADSGGFFYTSADHEALITRTKDSHDNATPSGNGMAAYALLRLGRLCSRSDIEEQAVATLEVLSGEMQRVAMASGQALMALDFLLGPSHELVLLPGEDLAATSSAKQALFGGFRPNSLSVVAQPGSTADPVRALFENRIAINGEVTLYACRQGVCEAPVSGAEVLNRLSMEQTARASE